MEKKWHRGGFLTLVVRIRGGMQRGLHTCFPPLAGLEMEIEDVIYITRNWTNYFLKWHQLRSGPAWAPVFIQVIITAPRWLISAVRLPET